MIENMMPELSSGEFARWSFENSHEFQLELMAISAERRKQSAEEKEDDATEM